MRYKHRNVKCDFVVVEGNCCSIISYVIACDLGVLKIVYSVQVSDAGPWWQSCNTLTSHL